MTLRVHEALLPRIDAQEGLKRIYREIEMPAREVIWRMERNGILIDSALLGQQSHELGTALIALENKAHELAGQPFNLNSPKQLADIPFEARPAGAEEDTVGRPLDRRGSALRTRARLPAAEGPAGDAHALQTEEHLHRQAAAHDQPADRPRAYQLLAGERDHRAVGQFRAEPAEHPGAHRRRVAASAQPSSRRPAAASSPPTIRRSSCASWRTSPKTRACWRPLPPARTSTAPPPPRSSVSRRWKSARTSAASPRSSTSA